MANTKSADAILSFTGQGLYCAVGDFYIDPWRAVDRAVITHAHSDHARSGSRYYLCHTHTAPLLRLRLGQDIACEPVGWNEPVTINGVRVSLHPAGHIIGSSQVRVEYRGEVWVVTGDYKLEADGLSGVWEPLPCHHFITESTFGLPVYRWKPQEEVFADMRQWIDRNRAEGFSSIFIAYSLGKAQRILSPLSGSGSDIWVHGAIWNTHQALVEAGWELPAVNRVTPDTPREQLKQAVVIAPPSALDSTWMKRFSPYRVGVCSGWMQVRGQRRRRNVDAGFALSDHADWPSLLEAVRLTGAQQVSVTHGFTSVLSRYLREQGIDSREVQTGWGTEEDDAPAVTESPAN